ncbi:hypothetical protein [Sagittula salina]|uniref:Tyr recombinase domain-containing protein n=1 Tax=Sagittula salina TaxID=2820268 RepID=A0A940MRJ0_9RHOB|nr:hypothetical protein [Sagittula salina]MBP0484515.1 hypothetical protein [Sagittula salina]
MTERNSPIETLLDVYFLLPSLYSESSAEAYQSAFRRVEHLTGKRLGQLPANVVDWERRAAGIVWAGEFTRARTPEARQRAFDGFVGRVSAGIRRALETDKPRHVDAGTEAAWRRIGNYVAEAENTLDADGEQLLPNQSTRSIENLRARLGTFHPVEVDTATATAALANIPPDKVASFRRSIRFFNRLIGERQRHGAISTLLPMGQIGPLPTLRDRPMDWTLCTEAFRSDLDQVIERSIRAPRRRDRFGGRLGADPVADRRRQTRGRRRPIRNKASRVKALRSALSWLARNAFEDREPVYALSSAMDLITENHVKAAVERFVARSATSVGLKDAKETSSLSTWLADLGMIAQHNGAEEDLVWAIEDLRFDLCEERDAAREMSATREAFIKLIDRDPAVVRAIVTGPRVLLAEARRLLARQTLSTHRRTEALHLFMAAAMLAVQLARPLRTRNVHEMLSEGDMPELIAPRRERASAWLDIGRNRVKNRKPLEGRIPDWLWTVISAWIDEGRPVWRDRSLPEEGREADTGDEAVETPRHCANDHLFPALSGAGAVSRQLINKAWNRGMARLGITGLTPHMMRHVAATLYLARNPGDYPVVAALLADSLRTVETFYARGEGRAAMDLFAQVLTEIDPTLNLKGTA